MVGGFNAASAGFTEKSMAVATAFLDGEQLLPRFSCFSLVTVELHFAEEVRAARQHNGANDLLILVYDNVGSVATGVAAGEDVSELEVLLGYELVSANLNVRLHYSGTRRDT